MTLENAVPLLDMATTPCTSSAAPTYVLLVVAVAMYSDESIPMGLMRLFLTVVANGKTPVEVMENVAAAEKAMVEMELF